MGLKTKGNANLGIFIVRRYEVVRNPKDAERFPGAKNGGWQG